MRLAVAAYTHLLKAGKPELSSLFATELVVKSAVRAPLLPPGPVGQGRQ